MDLLCSRRVDPVHQSPRAWMYGFFTHGTDPPPRPYSLVFLPFPAIFAGCLPRPISVAGCPVTWLSPCFWYSSAVRLLTLRCQLDSLSPAELYVAKAHRARGYAGPSPK